MTLRPALAVLAALSAPACATFVSGSTQEIRLTSEPPGASVEVEPGWYSVKTPIALELQREESPLRLTFTMDGYQPYRAHIERSVNPWVLGNIAFGLLTLGIDVSSGAAVVLFPDEIHAVLVKEP